MIIVDYKVVSKNHIESRFDGQSWGNKSQQSSRVVVGIIIFHQTMSRIELQILNLKAL